MLSSLLVLGLTPPPRASPAPRLDRTPADVSRRVLCQCPTPGCNTELRAGKLAAHLLRCPALAAQRELEQCGYWSAGMHSGEGELEANHDDAEPITMTGDASSRLEVAIQAAHKEALGARLAHMPSMAALPEGLGKNAAKRERQHRQRSAIVRELASLGVLGKGHCIIELGAGNAELSLAISEAYPVECGKDALVLVDQSRKPKGRSGHARHSADAALAETWASCTRLKMAVQDVDLASLRDTLAPDRSLVVIAKHLCGRASDYALRAVVSACSRPNPPCAVVLGTCCHHACTWQAYPSRQSLCQLLSSSMSSSGASVNAFGHAEFNLLCRMSSRGVNGAELGPRADTGRRAKDLIDHGRAEYLRANGMDTRLITFVDGSVTPENVLIVGTLRSSEQLH